MPAVRAIVLVGGEGTRLRPLTRRTPKQLAPVLNRPLLEHLLLHLRAHDVDRVTLALTRTPGNEAIRAAFDDGSALGLAIDYAYEDSPLGSGGAIAGAARGWDETFLVCNGDIITDLDVTEMMEAHRARAAELSIFLHPVDDPSPFGVVALDEDGRITQFVEKPTRADAPSKLINAGIWVFEPSLLAEMDAERHHMVERELFPELAGAGRAIFGFDSRCYWSDVGNPDAYRRVNLELLRGVIPERLPAGWPASGLLSDGASLDARADVRAPALIGAGSHLEGRARVERSVLGERCTIGADARVEDSVLWDGVSVQAGATVRDSVLASGVTVGAGASLHGAVVAHDAAVEAGEQLTPGTRVEPGERRPAAASA